MTTELTIQLRCAPVVIRDERNGEKMEDKIVLELNQIKAADAMGFDFEEIVHRQYNRRGYTVLEIGKVQRQTITINLEELYRLHSVGEMGKREKVETNAE